MVLEPELELSKLLVEREVLKLLDELLAGDTKCGTCGKVFCTKELLYSHGRNRHVDLDNCNTCHKYFDSIVKRNIHIQKMHASGPGKQQRAYECVACGKVLGTRNDLSQHMRIHNKIGMVKMNPVSSGLPCNNCKNLCE